MRRQRPYVPAEAVGDRSDGVEQLRHQDKSDGQDGKQVVQMELQLLHELEDDALSNQEYIEGGQCDEDGVVRLGPVTDGQATRRLGGIDGA